MLTGQTKPTSGTATVASYVRFWFTPYIWLLKAFGVIDKDA
jgi:hypothetical protein